MTKKVLVITSSFRKNGNTDILADQFAKGAGENGNDVEVIHLRDYKINYCMGCMACVELGRCVQKNDDFNSIFPKLMEADSICFAAPTYFYNIDGRMKTFFDRCVTIYGRMRDKDFYYLTASQSYSKTDIDSVFTAFHSFARCFSGIREKGSIYGVGSDNKGDVKSTPAYNDAYELGKTVD